MTKICTSIEQSKKLIELGIDASTADMYIGNYVGKSGKVDGTNIHYYLKGESFGAPEIIPAWSLPRLLEMMPCDFIHHKHYFLEISKMGDNSTPYMVRYFRFREESDMAEFGRISHVAFQANILLDAAFKMIVWLKKFDLL